MKCGLVCLPLVAGFDVKAFTSDTGVNHSAFYLFILSFFCWPQVENDPDVEQTQKSDDGRAAEEDVGMDNSGDAEGKGTFIGLVRIQGTKLTKFKKGHIFFVLNT